MSKFAAYSIITKTIIVLLLMLVAVAAIFTLAHLSTGQNIYNRPSIPDDSEILDEWEFQIFLSDIVICDCINISDKLGHGYNEEVNQRCASLFRIMHNFDYEKSESTCWEQPSIAFERDIDGNYGGVSDYYYDYYNNRKQ